MQQCAAPEMQKVAVSGANFWAILGNFWAILGHFWAIWAILGNFWAIMDNFGSFFGYFGSFFGQFLCKFCLAKNVTLLSLLFFASLSFSLLLCSALRCPGGSAEKKNSGVRRQDLWLLPAIHLDRLPLP